jgi:hypothetical protein
MFGDILTNLSDQELADTALYNSIISLLEQVKIVHGGQGLNSTLSRHKKLTLFLTNYQKRLIVDLESKITPNLHCEISKGE